MIKTLYGTLISPNLFVDAEGKEIAVVMFSHTINSIQKYPVWYCFVNIEKYGEMNIILEIIPKKDMRMEQ